MHYIILWIRGKGGHSRFFVKSISRNFREMNFTKKMCSFHFLLQVSSARGTYFATIEIFGCSSFEPSWAPRKLPQWSRGTNLEAMVKILGYITSNSGLKYSKKCTLNNLGSIIITKNIILNHILLVLQKHFWSFSSLFKDVWFWRIKENKFVVEYILISQFKRTT